MLTSISIGVCALSAYRQSGLVIPSGITALWEPTTGVSTSGSEITSWTDRLLGRVMTGAGVTKPQLVTVNGGKYVEFNTAGYFTRSGLTWDMQNHSYFMVFARDPYDASFRSLWYTTGAATSAAVFSGRLYDGFYNGNPASTGKYGSGALTTYYSIETATAQEYGASGLNATFASNTAGVQTAANLFAWDTPPTFAMNGGYLVSILEADTGVNSTQRNAILDWCTTRYGAVSRTAASFAVFDGDSRTAGFQSSDMAIMSYPRQLANAYASEPLFSNVGVSGATAQGNTAAAKVLESLGFFTPVTSKQVAVYAIGINDIANNRTDVQIEADIASWVTTVKAGYAGCKLIGLTILPKTGLSGTPETYRQNVNTWIKTLGTSHFDYYVDIAVDSRLSNPADTTYYNADGLHPNDAGYAVCASLVKAVIDSNTLL